MRLHFSESVGLALTRITLLGPDGSPVTLAKPVQVADSAQVVVVRIEGALRPGVYQVVWQTAGRDGHPVRGRYEFTVAEGAAGATGSAGAAGAAGAAAPGVGQGGMEAGSVHGAVRGGRDADVDNETGGSQAATATPNGERSDLPAFSAESPLYALVRFLLFLGILGVIGAIAFRILVVARVVRRGKVVGYTLAEEIGVRPARVGGWFSLLLGTGLVLRLVAQGYALGGGAFDAESLRAQLVGTVWGWGWLAQVGAVVLAWRGFRWASRGRLGGWGVAGLGAVVLGLTTGLSGHAAGLSSGVMLALLADAGHVLGAGGWLGGLLLLVGIGVPAALRVDERWSGAAVVELVHAFSGMALCCAGVVVLTGGVGALIHVGSVANLLGTGYGRTLVLKLVLLGLVVGAGAYNYLRVRPVVGEALGARRLRTTSTIELVAGAVVLVVTAVLVALPTP